MINFRDFFDSYTEKVKEARQNLGLLESLDTPVKVKYRNFENKNEYTLIGDFDVNNKKFVVVFDIVHNLKFVHVSFRRIDERGSTVKTLNDLKPKEVLAVYSTVANETKRFSDFNCIYFSSDDYKKLNSYIRVANKVNNGDFTIFIRDDEVELYRTSELSMFDRYNRFKEKYKKVK